MQLPSIECVTTNFTKIVVGDVTVWFIWLGGCHLTPVAFRVGKAPRVVHQNDWGKMTGRYFDDIDGGDHIRRVDAETFQRLWDEAMESQA